VEFTGAAERSEQIPMRNYFRVPARAAWAETCRSVNAAANLPLLQQTKPPGFKAEAEVTPG